MKLYSRKSYIYAGITILCWSTMGTAFKLTLKYITSEQLVLFASLTSLLFYSFVLLITRQYTSVIHATAKQWGKSALMGLFNPMLYYLVLFESYNRIPAQEVVVLNYLWPMMLVVFSIIFLKQRVSVVSIVAIGISFIGAVIVATRGTLSGIQLSDTLGITLALLSTVFWAAFWILNLKDDRAALAKMFLNFLFGTTYIMLYCLCLGKFAFPQWKGVLGSLYVGIFEMGISFVLWLLALKYADNTARISNLVYVSPFISLLLVSVFVGEKISSTTVIGLIIIMLGIVLQQYYSYRMGLCGRAGFRSTKFQFITKVQ